MENTCTVSYDNKALTINLTINTPGLDGFRNDMFDALGDVDVVIANELHPDYVLANGEDVYCLTDDDEYRLKVTGEVTLEFLGKVDDLIDEDDEEDVAFMVWLRGEDWKLATN